MDIQHETSLTDYRTIEEAMEKKCDAIRRKEKAEALWFLSHYPVYTWGPLTNSDEIAQVQSHPSIGSQPTGRGGKVTFHGPGQLMIYIMIDLKKRSLSIHQYIHSLEEWMISLLSFFSIPAFRNPLGPGIWTSKGKIASIGVRISRGITSHGIALYINHDMTPFQSISPCGIPFLSLTSLEALGILLSKEKLVTLSLASCPFLSQRGFCTIKKGQKGL